MGVWDCVLCILMHKGLADVEGSVVQSRLDVIMEL